MRSLRSMRLLLLLFAIVNLNPVLAQEGKGEDAAVHAKASAGNPASRLPPDSVTQHAITLQGQELKYKATAGTLALTNSKGEFAARVFYVAYTVEDKGSRPVTFAFNGGPGAGAAFLNLGALGPRIVPFKDNGAAPVQPIQLADNPDSWLRFTDLVFVDPVGTGFSRATTGGEEAERAYWGVDKDINSMAQVVRLYLTQNGRELAPVFLAGESYGGFRVAMLSPKLLGMGFHLKGAVMISPALEFSMLRGEDYEILPLTFELPSITAANVEMRGGPSASLDEVRQAEIYSRTTYLVHLAQGLSTDDAVDFTLAKFTGLEPSIIAKHHGRVSAQLFKREYLKRNDRSLSSYDATVSVPVPRPSEHSHFDPILDSAVTVLAPAMTAYTAKELGFHTTLDYRLLNRQISGHWDFGIKPGRQGYAGSLDELEQARERNLSLKLLIVHGYTDLVTPYEMSIYLINQLRPIEGAAPIDIRVLRGGHMMYLRPASRAELEKDAQELYAVDSQ